MQGINLTWITTCTISLVSSETRSRSWNFNKLEKKVSYDDLTKNINIFQVNKGRNIKYSKRKIHAQ